MAPTRLAVIPLIALAAACSGGEPATEDSGSSSVEDASLTVNDPAPQAMVEPTTNNAPLATEDIDRWRRGLAAELGAVEAAATDLRASSTSEDTLNAISAATEMSTRSAGARAAGVDEERYQFIRRTLSTAVGYLSPLEQEMDVTQMPPEMVEQFEQARNENLTRMSDVLPAAVVEALRTQAAELRQQDREVTAARVRVADAAR